jgi:hypothetical protein
MGPIHLLSTTTLAASSRLGLAHSYGAHFCVASAQLLNERRIYLHFDAFILPRAHSTLARQFLSSRRRCHIPNRVAGIRLSYRYLVVNLRVGPLHRRPYVRMPQ